jgi:eukaryotic-like serine/threonine-protein kinase
MVLANRYQLLGRSAAGGIGEVWRASDLMLGRPVAARLLRPEGAAHGEHVLTAARTAARIHHPGIVRVLDCGQVCPEGLVFLVTELVSASSLASVTGSGPLEPAWVLEVLCQVTSALEVAHAAGLVHEDIRPGNLLLAPGGAVKLANFGLSHAGAVRGAGDPATPASDLYSLGVVAWELLAGRAPFADGPRDASWQADRPVGSLPVAVPAGVAALVADMTAADARLRPARAAGVTARCRQLLAAPMRALHGREPDSSSAARHGRVGRAR